MIREDEVSQIRQCEQLSIFDLQEQEDDKAEEDPKERALQQAMLEIKHKYGKNAVVKAKNLSKGGTAMERNQQIGGHKA